MPYRDSPSEPRQAGRDPRLAGIVPVLAVPFTPDGAVDLDGFGAVVDYVLGTGVSAVTLFGIASEFPKLTDAERDALRRVLLERTRERDDVAAVVSVTAHAREVAVAEAQTAVADGANILNLLPPHFLAPRPDEVLAHIEAVLAAAGVPVILQYAPAQTGTVLTGPLLQELAQRHPNLQAVKVESQPPGRLVADLAAGEPRLDGLVGYAGLQMLDALERGAVGVQPGCSFTEIYVEVLRRWRAGHVDAARDLHMRLLPYIATWMQHVEFIVQVEKTILHRRGIIAAERCRAPGWGLDSTDRALIERFLAEFAPLLDERGGDE